GPAGFTGVGAEAADTGLMRGAVQGLSIRVETGCPKYRPRGIHNRRGRGGSARQGAERLGGGELSKEGKRLNAECGVRSAELENSLKSNVQGPKSENIGPPSRGTLWRTRHRTLTQLSELSVSSSMISLTLAT